jgi:hypothetical protein
VDQARLSAMLLRVEHRHGDEWVRLEPSPAHDVAENDPERDWSRGRVYSCPNCEERVRVALDRDEPAPD